MWCASIEMDLVISPAKKIVNKNVTDGFQLSGSFPITTACINSIRRKSRSSTLFRQ